MLALAVANMNSRIRRDGLSAREIWTQRDQVTGQQLPLVDRELILNQNISRKKNHLPSAKSKATGSTDISTAIVSVGDLVFLKGDKDKLKAREKYLVTSIDTGKMCHLRKFTSSQFRSKVYVVPMAECYPLKPLAPPPLSQGPVRGQEHLLESDSDNESVTDTTAPQPDGDVIPPKVNVLPSPRSSLPAPPPVPDAINESPVLPSSCTPVAATPLTLPYSPDPPRRSSRERKAPFWCTQDWDLDRY